MAVYLDHNATAPPRPEALDAALPFITEHWGNPASTHALARRPAAAVERSRAQVAAWAGARAKDVIFTSGASEANHLAIRGAGRSAILVSAVEHPSALAPARAAGGQIVPVDVGGRVDLDALAALLADVPDGAGLVSVMAANNETGARQPLAEVAALVRAAGALLHVDAAQIPGRLPAPTDWDLLTISGHKAGGLKGAGALILRRGIEVAPQQIGGSQERSRRAGTVDTPAVVALGAAVAAPLPEGVAALRDRLEAAARALGAEVSAADGPRLPNTLHLRFPDLPGEAVVMGLDLEGVCASTGSACASGAAEPSHVMTAMGLDPRSGVRLSLGWSTAANEIEDACSALERVIARCRASSALLFDQEDSEWTASSSP